MSDNNEYIYFCFYKGPEDIFGKLVRWWTNSKYSHVFVLFDGYVYSAETVLNEVIKIEENIENINLKQHDIIAVKTKKEQKNDIKNHLEKQVGKKYDWLGIFLSQIIKLNIDNNNKLFCSELGADVIIKFSLCNNFKKNANIYSPENLFKSLKSCNNSVVINLI